MITKNKIKETLVQLFCTKIGLAIVSVILLIIFGIFSTHSTIITNGYLWCDYAMIIPGLYLIGLTLVMFYYAIKNTFTKK